MAECPLPGECVAKLGTDHGTGNNRSAQQFMAKRVGATVADVPGSHAIYVSNPSAVAALIEQAASGVK